MTSRTVSPAVSVEDRPGWRVIADGRGRLSPGSPPTLRRAAVMFAVGNLIALTSIALLSIWVCQRAAEAEALRDARTATELLVSAVVAPAVDDGLRAGDPAFRRLDDVVRARLLGGATVRVKLWDADGRVLYSDRPELVGQSFDLGEEERAALGSGRTDAEVSDATRPENRFERGDGPLLEVYRPFRTPDGTPLLFEQYFRYSLVGGRGAEVWRTFTPITIGAVAVLTLCQLPLVWGLVRRLRRAARDRETLLRQAIDASTEERRRIAADVHDGIVQGLAGASFTIAGAVDHIDDAGLAAEAGELRDAAEGIRDSIRGLRSMLVEVYPPSIATEGLLPALADLAAPLRARGIDATAILPAVADGLSPATESLVFRVAQECLRNVARHSGARTASLDLHVSDTTVTLEVADDGAGMDLDAAMVRGGHFGLAMLRDVTEAAGALLVVRSGPDLGTHVRLEADVS